MKSNKKKKKKITSSKEAQQNAINIENQRLSIIEERWLATCILTIHLEIEMILTELLKRKLPKPDKYLKNAHCKTSFSHKLVLCESLLIANEKLASAIWSLNKLRNELAHKLENVPSIDNLSKFIEGMSGIHPLNVTIKNYKSVKKLRTFQQIKSHFTKTPREEIERFVYVSLLLLRANVISLLNEKKIRANQPFHLTGIRAKIGADSGK